MFGRISFVVFGATIALAALATGSWTRASDFPVVHVQDWDSLACPTGPVIITIDRFKKSVDIDCTNNP